MANKKDKKTKGAKIKNVYQCEICDGTATNMPVVACDKCDKWHHFSCVGIKSIGRKDVWVCDKCKQQENLSTQSSQQSVDTVIRPRSPNTTLPSIELSRSPRFESTINQSTSLPRATTKPKATSTAYEYDLKYDKSHPHYQSSLRPSGSQKIGYLSSKTSQYSHLTSRRKQIELEILEEERTLKEKRDYRYLEEKYRILTQRYSSDKVTEKSYVSRNQYTRDWVIQRPQDPYSPSQNSATAVTVEDNVHSQDLRILTDKLEKLQCDTTSTAIERCDICYMVGENIYFGLCCTCNKIAHQACMDSIKIDDESLWICPQCKIPTTGEEKKYHSTFTSSNPPKIKNYSTQSSPENRRYCYICSSFDDEALFGKCSLCVKYCHHTCMDIIVIDQEDHWICPECKETVNKPKVVVQDTNQRSEKKPTIQKNIKKEIPSPTTKISVPITRDRPDNNTHRCEGCDKINNKLPLVACDVCDKWYHFKCIKLSTLDDRVLWICSKCMGSEPTSSEMEFQPSKLIPKQPSQTGVVESLPGARQSLTSSQIASRHVVTKDLPIFAGKPEQWPMFLSRFKNSTELCGYSDSENLDRLQKCLKGNALDAVHSRLLTAESVPEIIKTLEMLYGRPELIVNSLMKKIRSEPPPKADKLNTLVDFALSVKNVCATLEQANLNYHLSNPALIQELVEKLPTNIKIEWAKYKANIRNITLSTLGKFLYELAEVISTVTEPSAPKEYKNEYKPKRESNNKDISYSTSYSSPPERKSESKDFVLVHTENKEKFQSNKNSNECKVCQKRCQRVEICPKFLSYGLDQRWKEMYTKKLCRKCLGSHGRFCSQAKLCGVNGCIFKHHSLLHDEKRHSEEAIKAKKENQSPLVTSNNNFHHSAMRNVLLRIVPVILHFRNQDIYTFAYQDDGSDVTMVEESVLAGSTINGPLEPLCLLWTGQIHRRESQSRRIKLTISGHNEFSDRYTLNNVRTVKKLDLPVQTVIKEELLQKFPYLQDTPFIDYRDASPKVLIGSDNASLNVQLELIEGEINEPIASKSRIGWCVYGPIDNRYPDPDLTVSLHTVKCPCENQRDEAMHQQIKNYFTLENMDVQANSDVVFSSKEDDKALKLLKKYTKRNGDRFETALLWRNTSIKLPNSYGMALKRLQCLEKYKPDKIGVINQTIEDYIQKGYVSKLSASEMNIEHSRIWYLPIFPVTYPKKPDKTRTVFDAAARVKGISLNSQLLKGPDQLSSLLDILRRFREKRVAATGDIKEMFHQVKIRDEDKQAQRFLWRNGDITKEPDHYVMNVMTFGATCSPSAAQFIKNLNASEFEENYPRAVEAIIRNHYVDDLLDCQDTADEMIQLINNVKRIHKHGGFEIRNFLSNSVEVRKQFEENYDDLKKIENKDFIFGTERVLGMWWDTKNDNFTFSLKFTKIEEKIIIGDRMPTKREILKILMSIFDPLGLISHYLIHLKIILQDIWRSTMDWDDEISTESVKLAWKNWLEILPMVESVKIPRLYSPKMSPGTPNSIELHIFVDASEQAFSAVAYLRIEDDEGVDCVLVGSKAKVTPLKYLSIPRKELQSGVLGSRLLNSIYTSQTFKISHRQIWTDSATLLSWIRSDHRKYHQFVAHRIGEILENTNFQDWRWVPSKLNVADEATKWSKAPSFEQTNRWFSGPEFLRLPRSEWPVDKTDIVPDTLEEMKLNFAHTKFIVPVLINSANISSWKKLHRGMAYAIRFATILRARINKEPITNGPLMQEELIRAENLIIRQAQYEDFTQEMITLKFNKEASMERQKEIDRSSPLYTCSPYLDENGIIRIRGRIDLAKNISYDTRRPIILPRKNKITHLLVEHYHREYHHRNHRTVFNQIRQKYFVPRLRVVLNSVKNECQKCKIKRARPQPPEMADLPTARLAIGLRPFTYTGMDFFGPMLVVLGRRVEKRWGVIFTCMTIRAIHIEISYTINTDSCIMCVRNFMNTRGRPEEIYSDQGTNMKGMDNELQQLVADIDVNRLATEFTTCYTKWCFNPPASPHMGGIYERMIRSVKTCLNDILPTRRPTEDMLRSLLLEAVNIVNSRPLTYVPLDHDDDEVLTPNHFLLGASNGLKPPIDTQADGPILRSKWKENQRLAELFWTRFVQDFVPDLTRRTRWHQQVEPIQVNDIVLMVEETNIRNQYPKARVLETIIGSNGQVRRVKVLRVEYDGSTVRKSVLWRPAHSLAKLDVHRLDVVSTIPQGTAKTGGSVVNVDSTGNRREPETLNHDNQMSMNTSVNDDGEKGREFKIVSFLSD